MPAATLDESIRRNAPRARIRWAGAAAGLPDWSEGVRWPVRSLPVMVATLALIEHVRGTGWPIDLGPIPYLAPVTFALVVLVTLDEIVIQFLRHRRLDYRITTAGIFVADGKTVARYDLPTTVPVERGGSLDLGWLERHEVLPDGRTTPCASTQLVLAGLGPRVRDARVALDAVCGPLAPRPEALSKQQGRILAVIGNRCGAALCIAVVFPALLLVAVPMIALVANGVLGARGLSAPRRWRLRRALYATHEPLSTTDFATHTGASELAVDAVRRELARQTGVEPARLHPSDRLQALMALEVTRFIGTDELGSLVNANRRASDTVEDLVRRVDAALEPPLP